MTGPGLSEVQGGTLAVYGKYGKFGIFGVTTDVVW